MTEDVNIHVHGHAGHLSLNRPKVLHALTLDMCHAISAALTDWADDEAVQAIILDHAEGRGFCAGGDINLLRNSALNDGGKSGREFFHDEYQLNHQMFEYEKPIVAFMDGITMGGGVGIAMPCKYRVATENTRFAMPAAADATRFLLPARAHALAPAAPRCAPSRASVNHPPSLLIPQ